MIDIRPRRRLWLWISSTFIVVPLGFTALVYGLLSHSAATQWADAQKHLADSHHTLDFMALVPPPVPDDQNFFATPPLKDIARVINGDVGAGEPAVRRTHLAALGLDWRHSMISPPETGEGVDYGIEWDGAAWAGYFRDSKVLLLPASSGQPGKDILQGLASRQTLIAELNAGNNRAYAQSTPHWKDRPSPQLFSAVAIPYLNALSEMSRTMALHAQASVLCDEPAHAVDDVCTLLRLAEGVGYEPATLASLVATNIVNAATSPCWSILRKRSASEEGLVALARCLDRIDIRAIVLTGLRGQMATDCEISDTTPVDLIKVWQMDHVLCSDLVVKQAVSDVDYLLLRLNPRGVGLGNKANFVNAAQTHFIEPIESKGLRGFLGSPAHTEDWERLRKLTPGVFGLLARFELPFAHNVVERALRTAARLEQTRIACALERWLIKHGSYPDQMGQLVPEFLSRIPIDPIDDRPMRYRRSGERYQLWSLGIDGDDDGGLILPSRYDDPHQPRLKHFDYPGDWVWSYERLVPEPDPAK